MKILIISGPASGERCSGNIFSYCMYRYIWKYKEVFNDSGILQPVLR